MDTNRLSKSICSALNAQMTKEAHAAQIYLSYASWAAFPADMMALQIFYFAMQMKSEIT